MSAWRQGRTFAVHVYEGDRPVATFASAGEAAAAVAAHNLVEGAGVLAVVRLPISARPFVALAEAVETSHPGQVVVEGAGDGRLCVLRERGAR